MTEDGARPGVVDERAAADRTAIDGAAPAPGRARLVALGALVAVLVATVVASVFLGREVLAARGEDQQRAEALRAARQLVVNFTTVDHRRFSRSTDGVLALAAGDFREQYSNASRELERLVEANRTVSRGKVLDAGVVSFDPDSARILVVADADVTNAAARKPQLRTYRLQLDLTRESAGWRVVDLQFVG